MNDPGASVEPAIRAAGPGGSGSNGATGGIDEAVVKRLSEATGHGFQNRERLARAITHASAGSDPSAHYERLEFVGDRVLGLLIAEMLFRRFPDASEGELSVRLNGLVNADALAGIADEMRLHEVIVTGADVKRLTGKRMQNVRADVIEALIAAIYLEGGLEAARGFIDRYWSSRADEVHSARRDAKTELQEWAHARGLATPLYRIVRREGPDHEPTFTVAVTIDEESRARGRGRSKRMAEQEAAESVLREEGVWKS